MTEARDQTVAAGDSSIDRQLDEARQVFQRIWGYSDFRPLQATIITSLLRQQDALVVLPTGSGKSLCFQLPALLQTGLTLVISPLIALIENQVADLRQRHLAAGRFHSELNPVERQQTLLDMEQGRLRLLYLSPESLLSQPIWRRLCNPRLPLRSLILDEAHCLADWGDSFRPTYRRLAAVRPALLKVRPAGTQLAIAAFTATADSQTQKTIQTLLELDHPVVFQHSPYRQNLQLEVQTVWSPHQRRQQVLKLLQQHPEQTGIIYTRSRRDCEALAAWLQARDQTTAAYHAGLGAEERRRIEGAWLRGEMASVVSTSAFGLGINKPDVRFVLHFHPPLTLSEYIQEMGRAGRDGKPAIARMLISEPTGWLDPEDRQRRQFFESQWRSQQQAALQVGQRLPRRGQVQAVTRQFREGAMALALLHRCGQLRWLDPFHYELDRRNSPPPLPQASPQPMPQYLRTRQCRWQFLLQAFGFAEQGLTWHCGHCDRCRRGFAKAR